MAMAARVAIGAETLANPASLTEFFDEADDQVTGKDIGAIGIGAGLSRRREIQVTGCMALRTGSVI